MATAGDGVPGLLTEGACQFAGTTFDTATTAVHDELLSHSENLSAAADRYQRTDDALGQRLGSIVK